MSDKCVHMNFYANVRVNRVTDDEDGPVKGFDAEVEIKCSDCEMPFHFLGLPGGYSPERPMVNVGGTELRAPIAPGTVINHELIPGQA